MNNKELFNQELDLYLFNKKHRKTVIKCGEPCVKEKSSLNPCKSISIDNNIDNYIKKEKEYDFSNQLLSIIDSLNLKDVDAYKQSHVSKAVFSNIRSNKNYRPDKKTVISFCFGLKLDLTASNKLLKSAGYVLSGSSIFDLICRYFLEREVFDMFALNEALFDRTNKTLF